MTSVLAMTSTKETEEHVVVKFTQCVIILGRGAAAAVLLDRKCATIFLMEWKNFLIYYT